MFTHRTDYNRPRNLQLVCDALNEGWGTQLDVNKKDDILYGSKWKVNFHCMLHLLQQGACYGGVVGIFITI